MELENLRMQIKICGITSEKEIEKLNELKSDYAGFILFFQKSKRNLLLKDASELKSKLNYSKSVAVTVSPSLDQVKEVESSGFDILQIHGELSEAVRDNCNIPIWRAINISKQDVKEIKNVWMDDKISGVVIDGAVAGSGEAFDWILFESVLEECGLESNVRDSTGKTFVLAGGLNPYNVADAIRILNPDVVDVSSGVEFDDKTKAGKDLTKVEHFIKNARLAV